RAPASRTRASSPLTSSAWPASRRGSSACPQESPNAQQAPPRNARAAPLPLPVSRVGRRGRAAGAARSRRTAPCRAGGCPVWFSPRGGRRGPAARDPVSLAQAVLCYSLRRFLMSIRSFLGQLLGGDSRRQGALVRKPPRFRPALEVLECRLAPAIADVTASVLFGNLTITDNAATSQLTLSQSAADEITITPDDGTTINGRAGPVTMVGVTGNLNVKLGAGNDTLTFGLSQHDIRVGNVSITGNTGAHAVVTDTAGTTHTLNVHGNYQETFGNGNQFTRLNQFNVSGNLTIDHADGDSFVFLGVDADNLGQQFNSVAGDLSVANVTASG